MGELSKGLHLYLPPPRDFRCTVSGKRKIYYLDTRITQRRITECLLPKTHVSPCTTRPSLHTRKLN